MRQDLVEEPHGVARRMDRRDLAGGEREARPLDREVRVARRQREVPAGDRRGHATAGTCRSSAAAGRRRRAASRRGRDHRDRSCALHCRLVDHGHAAGGGQRAVGDQLARPGAGQRGRPLVGAAAQPDDARGHPLVAGDGDRAAAPPRGPRRHRRGAAAARRPRRAAAPRASPPAAWTRGPAVGTRDAARVEDHEHDVDGRRQGRLRRRLARQRRRRRDERGDAGARDERRAEAQARARGTSSAAGATRASSDASCQPTAAGRPGAAAARVTAPGPGSTFRPGGGSPRQLTASRFAAAGTASRRRVARHGLDVGERRAGAVQERRAGRRAAGEDERAVAGGKVPQVHRAGGDLEAPLMRDRRSRRAPAVRAACARRRGPSQAAGAAVAVGCSVAALRAGCRGHRRRRGRRGRRHRPAQRPRAAAAPTGEARGRAPALRPASRAPAAAAVGSSPTPVARVAITRR